MQNNITFTSNINFVSERMFRKATYKHSEYIPFENFGEGKFSSVTSNFHTMGIRTCTAGGITDGEKAKGFHIRDSYENITNLDKIYKIITEPFEKPFKNILLIGSKDLFFAPYSQKIFMALKKLLMKNSQNFSYFQTFAFNSSEAHIYYNLPKDTWTINAQIFNRKKENYYSISTKEDLLRTFEDISIGKEDKLFINGKEIQLEG